MKTLMLHSQLTRPVPRVRLVAAALVLSAAISGAVVLYGHRAVRPCPPVLGFCLAASYRPSWVQPTALAVLLIGVTGAGSVLVARRRLDPLG